MKACLPLLLAASAILAAPSAFAAPAACPDVGEQLSDYLASAKRRVGTDGEVRVEFEVGADGSTRIVELDGSRQYRSPVRIAMSTLDCQPGTPQRYVLNIRFAEPMPRAVAAAASATVAQAAGATPPTPR